MKPLSIALAVLLLSLGFAPKPLPAAEAGSAAQGLANPFFAFDNGVARGGLRPQQQAALLAELGYAGIGYTGTAELAERLAAFDQRGLKIFSLYVGAKLGPDGPTYDPGLKQAVEQLRGRDTILWLSLTGNAPDAEEQAVKVVREIADLAAASSLRVALYPHVGFYVARTEDAVRIVRNAERKNAGVSFNLCHFLKLDDEKNLQQRLKEALPYLFLVSINGTDGGETNQMGWDRLIQTLDRGSFDNGRLLRMLKDLGYTGPIGLQCYQVKGDTRENLARSMEAWQKLRARPAADTP